MRTWWFAQEPPPLVRVDLRVQEDSCQPCEQTVNTYVSSREFSECQDVRIGAPAGVLKSVKSESRLQ